MSVRKRACCFEHVFRTSNALTLERATDLVEPVWSGIGSRIYPTPIIERSDRKGNRKGVKEIYPWK
jgi:hypothetical protein